MLLGVPLALPKDLKAGAVQHDMNGPVAPNGARPPSGEGTAATAERGVIRHAQIQVQQAQDRACEAFGLTQRQMEGEPQRQHQFNGHVRI
jgi:hypothetical protein